ncbi:MAG: hypothetical protein LQ352_006674 [Teloschistes flavicans]|nr:MAG: hypothetical protein LQ352_006674 [Teloschistes flavicans]
MAQPVTEIVRIPLQAGANIEDANSPAGKIMSDTLTILAQQEHYQRAYHGRQLENPSIVQLYIDWDSLDGHKQFMNQSYYPPFVKHLKSIVDGDLAVQHASLSPHPPAVALTSITKVTEVVEHYFPADISESDRSSFETNLKEFTKILENKAEGCTGFAGGWVIEELEHEEVEGKAKKEYCPPIDSALFYALIYDYDLSDHVSFSEARKTLDLLRESATAEGDSSFDPSGSTRPHDLDRSSSSQASSDRAQSWHGDAVSQSTESTSISNQLNSLNLDRSSADSRDGSVGRSIESPDEDLEALPSDRKTVMLRDMFPSIKSFDIEYALKKRGYNFGKTFDELLNQTFLESEIVDGEDKILNKGIDAFLEPNARGRKAKGKRKKQSRRTSSTFGSTDDLAQSSATLSRWDRGKEDVDFLAQRISLPRSTISSMYHASGASLPSTIASLCASSAMNSNPHAASLDAKILDTHIAELAVDFPMLPPAAAKALIQLTHPSTACAHELARAAVASPAMNSGMIVPQYAPRPPSPPMNSSQSKPRPIAMPLDTAERQAIASLAARSQAITQASVAYRQSKSKPLMGGAASYYSAVGRDATASLRRYEAATADARVASQSKAGEIDLHGVNVKDAVRIVHDKVEHWWDVEGQEWARAGKVMRGKVLASFVDPRQAFGPDKVIPPNVLANAKGLAVLTVFKAGFLGTARFGSGIVVARLEDGTWSAPSALATGGGGFGGQIGFELTDFVFILNNAAAVRTFSQQGSLTLGGNVSIAAGPVGRNAEAAGAASLKGVAAVFAYSKTKGLFAGVSLEGSVLIERRDANEKLYNSRITAKQLLAGGVRPPPSAEPLMRVLNSRVFAGVASQTTDTIYNDIPIYDDNHDNVVWEGRQGQGYNEGVRNNRTGSVASGGDDYEYRDRPQRASTWTDDVYDRQPTGNTTPSRTFSTRANPNETFDNLGSGRFGDDNHSVSNSKPGRPTAPKPKFTPKPTAGSLKPDEAVALYTFDADQPGDLGFKKGEIITITKRTENPTDWWTGKIGDRMGVFPSNYVDTT